MMKSAAADVRSAKIATGDDLDAGLQYAAGEADVIEHLTFVDAGTCFAGSTVHADCGYALCHDVVRALD
jgi:hypothetical protein